MLVGIAYAMGAPAGGGAAGGAPSMFTQLFPLIAIFAIFYFLLIRPQQKKAKEHRHMLDNLKKGDRVVTSGGIHGTIFSLTPEVVTLIIAENVKIKVGRGFIHGLAAAEGEEEKTSA
ncbi:MAG TPA: preprotein translocase subunit YajC [Nitrospirota bacterium]|nr:preprotein translocase subunit YajC [Nitrospirota bacterium]